MNDCVKIGLATVCIFLVSACSHMYTPDSTNYQLDPGKLPEFEVIGAMRLINNVSPGTVTRLGETGVHTWNGDLKFWTDSAIDYIKGELGRRHMAIDEKGRKSLKLAIRDVGLGHTDWTMYCDLTLDVETGSGYRTAYSIRHNSPSSIPQAMDGAVLKAVITMFNDANIVNYLKAI